MSFGEFCPTCRKYYGEESWHCKCHISAPAVSQPTPKASEQRTGESVEERARLYANCRNGQQVGVNFSEWQRSNDGYIAGDAARLSLVREVAGELRGKLERIVGAREILHQGTETLRRFSCVDVECFAREALALIEKLEGK